MKISIAVVMKKFCSYGKEDKKEDKKKTKSFKVDILIHAHKTNFTNTRDLIKEKVLN